MTVSETLIPMRTKPQTVTHSAHRRPKSGVPINALTSVTSHSSHLISQKVISSRTRISQAVAVEAEAEAEVKGRSPRRSLSSELDSKPAVPYSRGVYPTLRFAWNRDISILSFIHMHSQGTCCLKSFHGSARTSLLFSSGWPCAFYRAACE